MYPHIKLNLDIHFYPYRKDTIYKFYNYQNFFCLFIYRYIFINQSI